MLHFIRNPLYRVPLHAQLLQVWKVNYVRLNSLQLIPLQLQYFQRRELCSWVQQIRQFTVIQQQLIQFLERPYLIWNHLDKIITYRQNHNIFHLHRYVIRYVTYLVMIRRKFCHMIILELVYFSEFILVQVQSYKLLESLQVLRVN